MTYKAAPCCLVSQCSAHGNEAILGSLPEGKLKRAELVVKSGRAGICLSPLAAIMPQ